MSHFEKHSPPIPIATAQKRGNNFSLLNTWISLFDRKFTKPIYRIVVLGTYTTELP